MKKTIVAVLLVASVLVSGYFLLKAYKAHQFAKMGYVSPGMESKESIRAFSIAHSIPGTIRVAADSTGYDFISTYCNEGMIYFFDRARNLIETNIGSFGGTCHADVREAICNDFNFGYHNLPVDAGMNLYDSLRKHSVPLEPTTEEGNYDYTIFYGWAMYAGASYNDETLGFVDCLDGRVRLYGVNVDYIASYYHQPERPILLGLDGKPI